MTRKEAREAALVMLAYAEGAEVELRVRLCKEEDWTTESNPLFNYGIMDYRIKKPELLSEEMRKAVKTVFPEAKWLAWDKDGHCYFYEGKPHVGGGGSAWFAEGFSWRIPSLECKCPVSWEESLVGL